MSSKTAMSIETLLLRGDKHYVGEGHFVELGGDVFPCIKGYLHWHPSIYEYPGLKFGIPASGVYVLRVWLTGEMYVGSSGELPRRISQHKTDMRAGRHANKAMNELVKGKKLRDFDLTVIFTADREEAFEIEQRIINLYRSSGKLTNTSYDVRVSMRDQTHCPETGEGSKQCRKCRKELSLDQFQAYKKGKYRRHVCNPCLYAVAKEYREKNPEAGTSRTTWCRQHYAENKEVLNLRRREKRRSARKQNVG